MSKFLLAGCALGLFLSSASAQQKSPEQYREEQSHIFGVEGLEAQTYSRFVASGAKQRIDFYYSLNPDCSATGDVTVRVSRQPEHGTVETVTTTHYPRFAKENVRSNCNQHKVKGTLVNYKAAEKYTGNDEFDLLILYPGGLARELHFDISVR
jgi:RecJ-like exonuclease